MKFLKITFAILAAVAAVGIAAGAYWHIYTLGACAALVATIKKNENE